MSTLLPFGTNTIPTFVYEPFSYTISNPSPGTYTLTTSNTSGIPPGYLVNNGSNVLFATSSNGMNVGTEVFTVTARDASGTIVATSSNNVTIGAGRFLDGSGNGYPVGNLSTFYKNEPIQRLRLVAPFAISTPTSVPTLPPGLSYTAVSSSTYDISGIPLATVAQSNYLVIGKGTGTNLGKIVTSQIGMVVSNERILLNLSGTPIVSDMVVDSAITPRVLTARFPPYPSGGTLRYAWSGLPNGIVVKDSSGITQPGPTFTPSDPSATLIISGAPTITAANAYRDALITSNVVTFTATRTNPLPALTNSQAITFAFGETVLFDTPSIPTFYQNVALNPTATFFRAQTYFPATGSGNGISNITAPDGLPAGLTLSNELSTGRSYLQGTPTTTGSGTYTIRAINSNAVVRDLSATITVSADSVSFVSPPTPAVDICYNFILSRPISLDLSGYYTSNIRFQATAASGNSVTFSAPALAGTGLSLSNVASNTVQLVGIPDTITPLTTVTVTASATGTPATATRNFKLEILDDEIEISDPTPTQLSFIQNRAITPIQLTATTLSQRPVISFVSTNMPTGLSISTTGLISGTPRDSSGTMFSVTASTGYASEMKTYTYTLTPDSALFIVNPSYVYIPPTTVTIPIESLTYSGTALSNFAFSGFSPTYGLSIDSSGTISGTLPSGDPPGISFPGEPVNYTITATAGFLSGSLPSTFTASNIVVYRSFLLSSELSNVNSSLYTNDDNTYSNWTQRIGAGGVSLSLKNTSIDSNVYILPTAGSTYYRSTDGVSWFPREIDQTGDLMRTLYQVLYDASSSLWYGAGTATFLYGGSDTTALAFYVSSNDGLTWEKRAQLNTPPRQNSYVTNYFTSGGVALGSNNGVLLLGGGTSSASEYFLDAPVVQQSTDGGFTWSATGASEGIGLFGAEAGCFELAGEGDAGPVWVAAGSDAYSSGSNYDYVTDIGTALRWSDDQGNTWDGGSGTGLIRSMATQVVYGGGRWLATGFRQVGDAGTYIITVLSFSTNGKIWSSITLPGITFTELSASGGMPLPEINWIWTDETNWYVLVKIADSGAGHPCTILQHSLTGDLTTNWTEKATPDPFDGEFGTYIHGFKANYVRTGNPTTVTLGFDALAPNGPTVVSPTTRSFLFYQYVAINSITFSATGSGRVYYFVDSSTLPRGLTFDPVTATLSGTPVLLGERSFTVYVKDDVGVTTLIINTNVIIPVIQRQQTSAGSWTSLIRQYTVVNAAQNSINGRVLPATEPPLGEFMRPEPPDSSNDPACKKC